MPKLNLASEEIKKKTPPRSNAYYVTDTQEGRLLLKVHPSGVRSYHYSQGYVHGKRKRPVLAKFNETTASIMRKKVQEYNRLASEGINPFSEDLQKLTLEMFLLDHFMPNKQQPKIGADGVRYQGISEREYKNRMSMINAHIKGSIGSIRLRDMTYATVDNWLTEVSQKSSTQARNIRIFLVDAWREALRKHSDLRLPNFFEMWDIKTLTKKIKAAAPDPRPLNEDQDEGTAMYNAIEAAIDGQPLIARCIKLIYLMTTRKSDIATLQWDQIIFDKKREQYYFKETQEKDSEPLKYFGTASYAVIEELREVHKNLGLIAYKNIFPKFDRDRGIYIDKPITDAMLRTVFEGSGHGKITGILGAAGAVAPTLLGTNRIPKFTLHNFRDTVGTYLEGDEGQLALGHKSAQTTEQHYRAILRKQLAENADVREQTMMEVVSAKKD